MRRVAFLLGIWLISLAMASGRSVPSRKANNTKNRVNADYAAHWTATNTNTTHITANTTAITAVNTGSGGSAQENFLGSLTQLANFGLNATGGWSTSGVLGAGTWDSAHATALVGFMNAVFADLQDLLQALRNSNIIN
jgi:hypothetical protein